MTRAARPARLANGTHKSLVIVESPAKAKTIGKYLGPDYIVVASKGHVRDLPSSGMQVDLDTFQPNYEVLKDKKQFITDTRKLLREVDDVFLATDLDREGEAIAWHLQQALGLPDDRVKRVIFNAITQAEIQRAFSNPHRIDLARVNAQQARRVLDRIVGYEASPLLWRKVARNLSAGRVQSVALRLIVEREREIERFIPSEYWKVEAVLTTRTDGLAALRSAWAELVGADPPVSRAERLDFLQRHDAFVAELVEFEGGRFEAGGVEQARRVAEALGLVVERVEVGDDPEAKGPARHPTTLHVRLGSVPAFRVESVDRKRTTSRPGPPLITSTLQQVAASRLSFNADRTMKIAQRLYEEGYITYMRTDSTHLSREAVEMARRHIASAFGTDYLPEKPNVYASSNKDAQEAHEAIRPTDVSLTPARAAARFARDDARLYEVIWERFVACQMRPAEFDQTTVLVRAETAGRALFKATGRKLVFDGFMRVTGVPQGEALLPQLEAGQPLSVLDLEPTQHFTQPPARYTEASLVKKLEEEGIGRPSTYANIIQTIVDREYVAKLDRRFHPTQLGIVVCDLLVEAFPQVFDVGFTARMESELDQVEEGRVDWVQLLRDFYKPFHEGVDEALRTMPHAGGQPTEHRCPKCGKTLLRRISKTGLFLACEDRDCNTTVPMDPVTGKPRLSEESAVKCPRCGRDMVKRSGRFGEFLSCTGYGVKDEQGNPSCSLILNLDKEGNPQPPKPKVETSVPCEKCGRPMILRDSKRGPFLSCSGFPKCRATRQVSKLEGSVREYVEKLLPALKGDRAEAEKLVREVSAQFTPEAVASAPDTGQIAMDRPTDIDCPECGKHMVIRNGRRGPFLGCSRYPRCKTTSEVPPELLAELKRASLGGAAARNDVGQGGERPDGETAPVAGRATA
ncbi:MAG: DNA topoisomerase [Tepidisphaerales bacterium]